MILNQPVIKLVERKLRVAKEVAEQFFNREYYAKLYIGGATTKIHHNLRVYWETRESKFRYLSSITLAYSSDKEADN